LSLFRFAPSPTGLLHVGNARIAVMNALAARHAGGRLLLRLDDTDTARSRPEYAQAIEQDLAWLGIAWDSLVRQTDRLQLYAAAAEKLRAAGRLYPCFESEEELKYKREQRLRLGKPPVYDRGALKMTAEQRAKAEANGKRPYWRFLLSGRTVAWRDAVLGARHVKLPALSDPVLVRADGSFLYTFTSVVDDIDLGVFQVIRGEDHVTNTGIQIDLIEALGGAAPGFGHLPLLADAGGEKLSKRIGSLSLRSLRNDGIEPEVVVGFLTALGTGEPPTVGSIASLAPGFDLSRYGNSSARFDPAQLLALNRRHLHGLPFAAVRDRLPPGATEAFWNAVRGNLDLLSEARGWWEVASGTIVPPVIEGEGDYLRAAVAALPDAPWDATVWDRWIEAVKQATGRKGKALFRPLRLALTGEEHGPELREMLPLIGHDRASLRLRVAAGV